mgnify:CR=1 FL=1
MVGAVASFMIMAICARELSDTMNTFQILFLRSLVGFAIIILMVIKGGTTFSYTKRFKIHQALLNNKIKNLNKRGFLILS